MAIAREAMYPFLSEKGAFSSEPKNERVPTAAELLARVYAILATGSHEETRDLK